MTEARASEAGETRGRRDSRPHAQPGSPAAGGADAPEQPAVLLENVRLVVAGRLLLELDRWVLPTSAQLLVTGPSGSGKTSFLYLLAGLLRPASGRVVVAGRDLAELSEAGRDRFRGRTTGIVFQTLHLVRALNVLDNLRLAAFLAGNRVSEARLRELLDRVGLADRASARTFELSQGEAQRVGIARALVNSPRLVLADEPTSALDDERADAVRELLVGSTREHRAALVVATHDSRLLPHFDRRLRLGGGP